MYMLKFLMLKIIMFINLYDHMPYMCYLYYLYHNYYFILYLSWDELPFVAPLLSFGARSDHDITFFIASRCHDKGVTSQ